MEMWFELYSADVIPISIVSGEVIYYGHPIQDHLFLQALDIVDRSARLHIEPLSCR